MHYPITYLRERGYKAADGHEYVEYDAAQAASLLARLRELGRGTYRASPDLCHMLTRGHTSAAQLGYRLVCDPSLPPNGIIKEVQS